MLSNHERWVISLYGILFIVDCARLSSGALLRSIKRYLSLCYGDWIFESVGPKRSLLVAGDFYRDVVGVSEWIACHSVTWSMRNQVSEKVVLSAAVYRCVTSQKTAAEESNEKVTPWFLEPTVRFSREWGLEQKVRSTSNHDTTSRTTSKKKTVYFTCESSDTLKSFSFFLLSKLSQNWIWDTTRNWKLEFKKLAAW